MNKKYSGLNQLIAEDPEAKRYYQNLPDFVRNQIRQREQNINSLDSLRDYAENLLRGED